MGYFRDIRDATGDRLGKVPKPMAIASIDADVIDSIPNGSFNIVRPTTGDLIHLGEAVVDVIGGPGPSVLFRCVAHKNGAANYNKMTAVLKIRMSEVADLSDALQDILKEHVQAPPGVNLSNPGRLPGVTRPPRSN